MASLTQVQLAQACGVTRQTIYLIEVGKYNPTIALCQKICHALNTDLNSLFGTNE
nr:helix-turn-helix transcriptional regulator [Lactiplantibacillus plantarum]